MDGVRAQGLGDATTCCKESVSANCQRTCNELAQKTPGFAEMDECQQECTAAYASAGVSQDSCALPL